MKSGRHYHDEAVQTGLVRPKPDPTYLRMRYKITVTGGRERAPARARSREPRRVPFGEHPSGLFEDRTRKRNFERSLSQRGASWLHVFNARSRGSADAVAVRG